MIKTVKKVLMVNEREVFEYSMKNDKLEVCFINIGGALTKIALKEDNYNENLILRWHDYHDYIINDGYHGAIVGRTAGRIRNAEIMINNKKYLLDKNDGNNNLHGGYDGLSYKYFTVKNIDNGYELLYTSPHLESHFPGNLTVKILYTLEDNEFKITYNAISDSDTYLNLTNHMYFNLNGISINTIDNHMLRINASKYLEIDKELVGTGDIKEVFNTPFDFNKPKLIGLDINDRHQQMLYGNGYDINLVLDSHENCIEVYEENSCRRLLISTNYQAVQLYSGNFITDKMNFHNNRTGQKRMGLCLETQLVPKLDNILLKKDTLYDYFTIYKFTKE